MSIWVPEYYNNFECTPSECANNCCIGWEIDIDEHTANKYINDTGCLKHKLRKSIECNNGTYQFLLDEKERCPFLNNENLCEIILKYGKDSLCEICSEHPRFRNFIGTREEIGLGLTCEIACELILRYKNPFKLILHSGDAENISEEENEFLETRNAIINIVTDRNISFRRRLEILSEKTGIDIFDEKMDCWKEIFNGLEVLNDKWYSVLNNVNDVKFSECDFEDEKEKYENLLSYFIFRQFTPAFSDGFVSERLFLCLLSLFIIKICSESSGECISEIARLYSSEIEYSEDNVYDLLSEINIL